MYILAMHQCWFPVGEKKREQESDCNCLGLKVNVIHLSHQHLFSAFCVHGNGDRVSEIVEDSRELIS